MHNQFFEPLIKAVVPKFGQWSGLSVIAIGPKGGKIVGYKADGKPIYAGSSAAKKMAQQQAAEAHSVDEIVSWLKGLGIIAVAKKDKVAVSPASEKILEEQFSIKPDVKMGKASVYMVTKFQKIVGQPMVPQTKEEQTHVAARAAAGEMDNDPFPDLATLKQVSAGKYAGSHGNKLYEDESGQRWLFKPGHPKIARAEEAANRLAKLVLGPGMSQAAKHVKIDGKKGTLLEIIPGEPLNDHNHSKPPMDLMQKHFDHVVQHQVVDWLISNHDGHAGNYLESPDGKTIGAIDKGQAWKWIGKDKLDANYKPNASKQIFIPFWDAYKSGKLKGDPRKGAKKALDRISKISDDQFLSIVEPYIAERVKSGTDGNQLRKRMLTRLHLMKEDWEQFLSDVMGTPISLDTSEDNFETMPDTDHKAGWPMTKGLITINNPGNPVPMGVKWWKGYPGPGFSATMKYKKQVYHVEFKLVDGERVVTMTYPDGQTLEHASPDSASSSMVLFAKGLDLTLSATEKKKLKIGYPAGKAFGIKKFADELTQATSVPEEELKEKFTPEASGTFVDKDVVPVDAPEAYTVVDVYTAALKSPAKKISLSSIMPSDTVPPTAGWVSLPEGWGIEFYYSGDVHRFVRNAANVFEDDAVWSHYVDGVKKHVKTNKAVEHLFHTIESYSDIPLDITLLKPEATKEAPKVEPKKSGFTTPDKKESGTGPLPVGSEKEVKKSFLVNGKKVKKTVVLKALADESFEVLIVNDDPEGQHDGGNFKSLSAASDWVWVNQKGYKDADEYKAKNNTNKVPSGGGWKFWGIKPGDVVAPTVPDPASLSSDWQEAGAADLIDAPPGAEVKSFTHGGALQEFVKQPSGEWSIVGQPDTSVSTGILHEGKKAGNKLFIKPFAGAEDNFETMPEGAVSKVPTLQELKDVPIGTVLTWTDATPSILVFEKTGPNEWTDKAGMVPGGPKASVTLADYLKSWKPIGDSLSMTKPPQSVAPADWTPVMKPTVAEASLVAMPVGSKIQYLYGIGKAEHTYTKQPNGDWESGYGYVESPKELIKIIKDPSVFDLKEALPSKAAPPEAPAVFAIPATAKILSGAAPLKDFNKLPVGSRVWWTAPDGSPVVGVKTSANNWSVTMYVDGKASGLQHSNKELVSAYSSIITAGGMKYQPAKPPKPKKKVSKLKDNVTLDLSQFKTDSAGLNDKLTAVGATLLAKIKSDMATYGVNGAMIATKSPKWPAWVPPMGVGMTGEYEGKKYLAVSAAAGYSFDDDNAEVVEAASGATFAIFTEDGQAYNELGFKKPMDSLKGTAAKAGLPTDAKTLKKIFNLTSTFAPGESINTLTEGTGPKYTPIENLPDHAADLSSLEKEVETLGNFTFNEMMEKVFPGLEYTVDGPQVIISAEWPFDETTIQKFAQTAGTLVPDIKKSGKYVTATFPKTIMDEQYSIITDAKTALSAKQPVSDDNWDTMPEGVPKVINGSHWVSDIISIIEKSPIGTMWVAPGDTVGWQKTSDTEVTHPKTGKSQDFFGWATSMHSIIKNQMPVEEFMVVPPGEAPPAVEKGPSEAELKPAEEAAELAAKKKAELDKKVAEAKKTQAFLKAYPTVTSSSMKSYLAYVQKNMATQADPDGPKMWARTDPDTGEALIGSPDGQFARNLKSMAKSAGIKLSTVKAPFGELYRVSKESLEKIVPHAKGVRGPDNKWYPPQTTFKTVSVDIMKAEQVEGDIYKSTEHKHKPDTHVMLKVLGTGQEQVDQLKAIVEKYGLDAEGDPQIGPKYARVGVTKKSLEGVHETKESLQVKSPAQPVLKTAPVPAGSLPAEEGQPAVNNRFELAALDAAPMTQAGRWIRCGKSGIFWDDQVRVKRVKGADGKMYYDVFGHVRDTDALKDKNTLESGSFKVPHAKNGKVGDYHYSKLNYDAEAGIFIESEGGSNSFDKAGLEGSTVNGSKIHYCDAYGEAMNRGLFRVRVDASLDVESELTEAFNRMGLDAEKAMAIPDETDEATFMKYQVLRASYGPSGYFHSIPADKVNDDAWLTAEIKKRKVVTQLKEASLVQGPNGKAVVRIEDKEAWEKKGARFVYSNRSTPESVIARLIENDGLYSNREKRLLGIVGSTNTESSDANRGGNNAVFCRFGNPKADGDGWGNVNSSAPMMVFKPEVLHRADWYAHASDKYGDTSTSSSEHATNTRAKSYGHTNFANEINFEGSMSFKQLAGITCHYESHRDTILKGLKDAGITEFNGIPIEEFVIMQKDSSRSYIADNLKGLQPGVIDAD